MRYRPVHPNRGERWRVLPGDRFIDRPSGLLTHAVTIWRPRSEDWPWLVQMGAGRAGWYSYDRIDNGGHPSAERVVPELQWIEVGTVFPAKPGVTEGFVVLAFEPERYLILGWPSPAGPPVVTWAFILEEPKHRPGAGGGGLPPPVRVAALDREDAGPFGACTDAAETAARHRAAC